MSSSEYTIHPLRERVNKMELMDAVKGRRSIRKYQDKPVPKQLIKKVLEAGIWAPSAKNMQQWRFTVLTGKSKDDFTSFFQRTLDAHIKEHGEDTTGSALYSCTVMKKSPVLIMVWNAGEWNHVVEEHSVAAAIQNMLLRAHELGLGSLWIADIIYGKKALEEHLGKTWSLSAAITLGYPDGEGSIPPKMTVEEVTEFKE